MTLLEAIAAATKKNGVTSEEALGKLIGVSGVTVMSWRRGMNTPTPEHAQRLAELAAIDPAPFVADMLIRRTKDKKLRKTLERFKRAVAAAAAALPAFTLAIAQTVQHCILC